MAVPVNVVLPPKQMESGTADVVPDTIGFTVTLAVAVDEQPFTSVPVTVYTVLAAGTNDTPSKIPPLQL